MDAAGWTAEEVRLAMAWNGGVSLAVWMGGAAVEAEGAVGDGDASNRSPKVAAIAAMTTSRPTTRILRSRIRRVAVRADAL